MTYTVSTNGQEKKKKTKNHSLPQQEPNKSTKSIKDGDSIYIHMNPQRQIVKKIAFEGNGELWSFHEVREGYGVGLWKEIDSCPIGVSADSCPAGAP